MHIASPPTRPQRLLLVEDDPDIAALVSSMLQQRSFTVFRATDARSMDRVLRTEEIDLVILDLMLPGEDGLSICRRLRERSSVPVLMLTALAGEADRVIGLETGADDYLPKPFAPRELLARIRALLRRAHWNAETAEEAPTRFQFDGWQLDTLRMILLSPAGAQVPLTTAELGLLTTFCRQPQQVLTREQLLATLHQQPAAVFDRAIDTLIGRLRRKIEDDLKEPSRIKTVRNGGYIFTPAVDAGGREIPAPQADSGRADSHT